MVKRTIPNLAKFLATTLGQDVATVSNIARRCREAKLLSQGKPGPGAAEATSEDAAKLLLAVMATPPGSGVRAPERLKLVLDMTSPELDARHEFVPAARAQAEAARTRADAMLGKTMPAGWGPVDIIARALDVLRAEPGKGGVPTDIRVSREPTLYGDFVEIVWVRGAALTFKAERSAGRGLRDFDRDSASTMQVVARVGRPVLFQLALWLEGKKD